jgi:hypothetical protein
MAQVPPQFSPDGRWWWDSQRWVPAPRPQAAAATNSSNRSLLLIGGVLALVAVLGVCGMGVCAIAMSGGGGSNLTGSAGPPAEISGVYTLKQIDGHELPAGGSFHELVTDGTLELKADGTYVLRFSWQGSTGASRYTGDDGPYTRTGDSVTFSPSGEDYKYTGRLSGSSILLTYDWSRNGGTDTFLFTR